MQEMVRYFSKVSKFAWYGVLVLTKQKQDVFLRHCLATQFSSKLMHRGNAASMLPCVQVGLTFQFTNQNYYLPLLYQWILAMLEDHLGPDMKTRN